MKTSTTWKHDHAFNSKLEDNSFDIDGDKKEGPNPKALPLSALAACSAIDVVDILKKMRVAFDGLEVDAEAEQTEEHPRVFRDIMLTYHVQAAEESRDAVIKAINLSLEKYCGVSAMLRKNSAINYTLDLLN